MVSMVWPLALVTIAIPTAASLAGQGRGQQTPPILDKQIDSILCIERHSHGGCGLFRVAAELFRRTPAPNDTITRNSATRR